MFHRYSNRYAIEKLECAVEKAFDWFELNGMKLNSSKCHLLVCGHKHKSMICKIGNVPLIEKQRVKLLGISIESELTFDSHLKSICKKAQQCAILSFY